MRAPVISLVLAAALVLGLGVQGALAGAVQAPSGDMSLGNPKAPVQVTEYASMSCPHCAHFNADVFPELKRRYIDTGKVHYTLKEFLTPPENVAMAGFIIARCGGADKYFPIVDGIFRSQPQWTEGNIFPVFLGVAQANGLTEAQVRACMADTDAIKALTDRVEASAVKDHVESTPTVVVNGKPIPNDVEMTLETVEKAIASAGAPSKGKPAPHAKAKGT
jgi:protein-disulfide isomerase